MKRFKPVILTIYCFCMWSVLNAQQADPRLSNDILQPEELLQMEIDATSSNAAYIQQIGDRNSITLEQRLGADDGANIAKAYQDGFRNRAILLQNGNANELGLLQAGEYNFARVTSDGNNNNLLIVQEGNNNKIVQRLINSDQINAELIQQGNNNEIIQVLQGISNQNYRVEQIGNNLKIEIRQTSY